MESVTDRLSALGIPYTVFARDAALDIADGLSVCLSREEYLERSARAVFYMTLESGGEALTYLTQATGESPLGEAAETAAKRSEYLVYGSDGPKRKEIYRIPTDFGRLKVVFLYGEANERYLSPISRRALSDADCIVQKDE